MRYTDHSHPTTFMPATTKGDTRDLFASTLFSIHSVCDEILFRSMWASFSLAVYFWWVKYRFCCSVAFAFKYSHWMFVTNLLCWSRFFISLISIILNVFESIRRRRHRRRFQVQRNVWKCLFFDNIISSILLKQHFVALFVRIHLYFLTRWISISLFFNST